MLNEIQRKSKRWNLSSWGPAFCISTALVVVLLLGGWGAYQDWQYVRQIELRSEVTRVRSHSERTVGRLERQMSELKTRRTLADVAQEFWLRDHWSQFLPPPDLIYGAVVDDQGLILSHSDPTMEGKILCSGWNQSAVSDAGTNVYATNCPSLTGGRMALDIVVSIQQEGKIVGAYHAGVNWNWIEQQITAARRRSAFGWGAVIGGIIVVVLLSSLSLYVMTRRSLMLEDELRRAQSRRLVELNQLMIGLAHEIRNPMNAVRLNLYTADRVFHGDTILDNEEVSTMLGESVREIERIDELMTVLLGYARADALEMTTVDVGHEIRGVVQFLEPMFQTIGIKLEVEAPEILESRTRSGRGQVRQVLLNLLNNARDAVPAVGGRVKISLQSEGGTIDVRITDNGGGIPSENRAKLFSPFFSTKEHGTGLGLALVRSLMERSGGSAECSRSEPGNCQFRVTWPKYSEDHQNGRPEL